MLQSYTDTIEARLTGRHKKSLQLCGSFRNLCVLDIGCSIGWLERAAIADGAARVYAIDLNRASLLHARAQVPGAWYLQASGTHLPLAAGSVDLVTAFEVLEHLPKGTECCMVREIHRVLRPGGRLLLSTPADRLWSKLLDPAWYWGHRHYTPEDVIALLEECGFAVQQRLVRGGFYELFGMIGLYIFKWCFRAEIPFKPWWDVKRDKEYLENKDGIATIFIIASKM
jgi:SAM-dependent methyltransferase